MSAVIPTWNEEPWLPALLGRLTASDRLTDVVVADNDSEDATVPIALAAGCQVVAGGRPSQGKNAGAARTAGELILFVDADVAPERPLLETLITRFQDPSVNLVFCRMVPASRSRYVRLCYLVADAYARSCAALGMCRGAAPLVCVRREAFLSVGGFDESVTAGADADFIRRVNRRAGGVIYLRHPPLLVSARRFDLEHPVGYPLKCVLWGFLRFIGVHASGPGYQWRPYTGRIAQQDPLIATPGRRSGLTPSDPAATR